jgi:type II secretory pathway component PulF
MTTTTDIAHSFAYQAQTPDGLRMSGTVDAQDVGEATRRLVELGLRVVEISPAAERPARPRALRASDFAAFNQQLATLAKAGLPLEHGLRLIAADLRGGRLSRTIELVALELERGTPLPEAFEKHSRQFPPLYGRLVGAGVRSGNLPGVLFNLGRHLELVQRLRESLWRALAYPSAILIGLAIVLSVIGWHVLPKFEEVYRDFRLELPGVTQALLAAGQYVPFIAGAIFLITLGLPLIWMALKAAGREGALTDFVARYVPVVGPVIRRSLAARWCDLLKVAIASGMDLPAAIRLASEATGSPALIRDGEQLAGQLESGQPLDPRRHAMLPPSVPATIQFSAGFNDLPSTLDALSEMSQRQAELRVAAIPAIITPAFVLGIGFAVGFIVLGLMMPIITLIQGITGVSK